MCNITEKTDANLSVMNRITQILMKNSDDLRY